MWISYYILLCVVVCQVINGHGKTNNRQKRYLLFTSGTQFGVFATVSVPLHPENTVSVAWFFEANYYNVANATYFEPLLGDITISRKKQERSTETTRDPLSRRSLYIFIESMFEKHGYSGRSCLLRAICDNVTKHFLHNGILGDLLHLAFTPSTTMTEDGLEDCYYEAEYYGMEQYCLSYEEACPISPLEQITIHLEEPS